MNTNTPNESKWQDINLFLWRASEVKLMGHNAGLPPAAIHSIIRECSELANINHELFLKLAGQKINMAIDQIEMLQEGYSDAEIATYLRRNYGIILNVDSSITPSTPQPPQSLFIRAFEGQSIRVVLGVKGEFWFVASDVCRILGLNSVAQTAERLDNDEKRKQTVPTKGGPQQVITINESGLYSLLARSRKPHAPRFRRWLASQVPSPIQNGVKNSVGVGSVISKNYSSAHDKYRSRKRALPAKFTTQEWQFALDYFQCRCAACGRKPSEGAMLVPDHWVPLASPDCPGTLPENIIPLCRACNSNKSDHDPHEWLISKLGLEVAEQKLNEIGMYFSIVRKNERRP